MPIIKVDVTLEEWLSAPEWQRDKTNRGRLMIVAIDKPTLEDTEQPPTKADPK